MQQREADAEGLVARAGTNKIKLRKALRVELRVLADERAHLVKKRGLHKTSADEKLRITREITSIDNRTNAIGKQLGAKIKGGVELWTPEMRIRLAKAQRTTKNLKDDVRVLRAEEQYLRGLLRNRKLTKDQRAKINEELTAVHKQIVAQNDKIKQQMQDAADEKKKMGEWMFSLLNEKSSFFASFAPNVFTQQLNANGDVNRSPGSAGTGIKAPATGAPTATALPGSTAPSLVPPGGKPMRFAKGGVVPGRGNRDSVPAMLTPGEAVLTKASVASIRNSLSRQGKQNAASLGAQRPNTHVTVEQHFQAPPSTDGSREARYAEIAAKAVFDGGWGG